MSYRLITKATLVIVNAAGATLPARELDVRAYPSPKRDAVGTLTLDGNPVAYKRTGGKGRGTNDRRYAYFAMGAESAYIEITEAEAGAFVGGQVTVTRIAATAAPAPVAAPKAPKAEQGGAPEARVIQEQRAATKAPRRVKGQARVAA